MEILQKEKEVDNSNLVLNEWHHLPKHSKNAHFM